MSISADLLFKVRSDQSDDALLQGQYIYMCTLLLLNVRYLKASFILFYKYLNRKVVHLIHQSWLLLPTLNCWINRLNRWNFASLQGTTILQFNVGMYNHIMHFLWTRNVCSVHAAFGLRYVATNQSSFTSKICGAAIWLYESMSAECEPLYDCITCKSLFVAYHDQEEQFWLIGV